MQAHSTRCHLAQRPFLRTSHAHGHQLSPFLSRRLCKAAVAPESSKVQTADEQPPPKTTSELAKEALIETVSGKQNAQDVLGESTIAQLKTVLGEERSGQLISVLDGFLANRRLATIIFAIVDVALIWVLIKFFKVNFFHD